MMVSAVLRAGLKCGVRSGPRSVGVYSRAQGLDKVLLSGGFLASRPQNASFLSVSPVFGVEPDLTREGGSIPVTLTFQEATGKNVMLLPVGSADDGAHSQNEKLNR